MSLPIVLVNPGSGPKGTSVDELASAFGDLAEVRAASDRGMAVDVTEAVDAGAGWVGVAGGDGSQRLAAPVLAAARRPLLPVPCGTRNHFSKDVGIDSVEAAVAAAKAGETGAVDLAWVGDECFVNTCNLGMYTAVVKERERQEGKLPKRVADSLGIVREAVRGHRLRLVVDGRPVTTWAVFIGNGRYGEGLGDLARDALDAGILDVRIVMANQRVARLRLVGALIGGRLGQTPVVEQTCVPACTIETPGCDALDVALDADVVRLQTPLRLRVEAGALTVLRAPAAS